MDTSCCANSPLRRHHRQVRLFHVGRPFSALLAIIMVGVICCSSAQAQAPAAQRERILDEPFRLRMDQDVPAAKRALFDWGGWFRNTVLDIDDNVDRNFDGRDEGRHTVRRQQLYLWGNLNFDQVHQIYVRGRLEYEDWNHGTSYDGRDHDWYGPKLDRAWYDFRLSRALNAYGHDEADADIRLRVGRQYVNLGTGLALSLPLDALVTTAQWNDFALTGLLALSTPEAYNVDFSVPFDSKENRRYWGVELRSSRWPDHEPFAYFFSQEDRDAGITAGGQTYGYDSHYTGLGSRGKLVHRDLQYTFEFVSEQGKSYAFSPVRNRQSIEAWAFDSEVRYVSPGHDRSQLVVGYLLASGDGNRNLSPTTTVGGNRLHSEDGGFSAWGFRNTGLVLAPRISNLGMVRLGASTFPGADVKFLKDLEVGADVFLYHKQQEGAPMSDSLSTDSSNFVGTEVDLYANWRVASDLALSLRYGVFMPGDAMTATADRQQLFAGVTINF